MEWGFQPILIALRVFIKNIMGTNKAAKYKKSKLIPTFWPTKKAIIKYPISPKIEKIPLLIRDVLPDSTPLAISLVAQYDVMGSIIRTYVINPPINAHVPNSSWGSLRVTIIVKINPVNTLVMEIANEINPEYVTRIFDNTIYLCTTMVILIPCFYTTIKLLYF